MRNVLVTGDLGYIGSVLVPKIIDKGFEVIGFDTGYFEEMIDDNHKKPVYKTIKKDIRKITKKDLEGIDSIIHLSALSNDPMGEINPMLTEEINYKASVRLARLAKEAGVKRFIFSSSCSVYGFSENGIVSEESKANPLTAYAESKIKTEKKISKLADDKFFVGILRNSTVYGYSPRFRSDLVVNNLVLSALLHDEIRIMSDGSPWRPLIDVRDLSDIFILFLETKKKSLNGKVVNIGFEENNFQVKNLANIIKKQIPTCKIVYTGEHGKDSRSYKVDFTLFKNLFPDQKQNWNMNKSVKNLIKELKSLGVEDSNYNLNNLIRIEVLKDLIKDKKINNELYWI